MLRDFVEKPRVIPFLTWEWGGRQIQTASSAKVLQKKKKQRKEAKIYLAK